MDIIIMILIGLAGGVFGGMGMGGGTLLIPLVTIFLGTSQQVAQAVNLLAFVPMSIIALVIHIKNKLIRTDLILPIVIPAIISGVGFSYVATIVSSEWLKIFFGIFLTVLGIYQLIVALVPSKKKQI